MEFNIYIWNGHYIIYKLYRFALSLQKKNVSNYIKKYYHELGFFLFWGNYLSLHYAVSVNNCHENYKIVLLVHGTDSIQFFRYNVKISLIEKDAKLRNVRFDFNVSNKEIIVLPGKEKEQKTLDWFKNIYILW